MYGKSTHIKLQSVVRTNSLKIPFIVKYCMSVFVFLQNGNVTCSPHLCPALICQNPVHHAGDCCPRYQTCVISLKSPWSLHYSPYLTHYDVSVLSMWLVGVRSVSMSPGCMRMDRNSPLGGIPAFDVTALWVRSWKVALCDKHNFMWLHLLYDVFARFHDPMVLSQFCICK